MLQVPILHPGECVYQVVRLGSLPWLVTLYFNLQLKCALKGENQQGAFQEWRANYKIQEAIENWYKACQLIQIAPQPMRISLYCVNVSWRYACHGFSGFALSGITIAKVVVVVVVCCCLWWLLVVFIHTHPEMPVYLCNILVFP